MAQITYKPTPGAGEVKDVARQDGNRQHHERDGSDYMRGQEMVDRKTIPGHARQNRAGQEAAQSSRRAVCRRAARTRRPILSRFPPGSTRRGSVCTSMSPFPKIPREQDVFRAQRMHLFRRSLKNRSGDVFAQGALTRLSGNQNDFAEGAGLQDFPVGARSVGERQLFPDDRP
jgi:hypothetical protein